MIIINLTCVHHYRHSNWTWKLNNQLQQFNSTFFFFYLLVFLLLSKIKVRWWICRWTPWTYRTIHVFSNETNELIRNYCCMCASYIVSYERKWKKAKQNRTNLRIFQDLLSDAFDSQNCNFIISFKLVYYDIIYVNITIYLNSRARRVCVCVCETSKPNIVVSTWTNQKQTKKKQKHRNCVCYSI